jgi:fluoroquinolone transport system permease protein
MNKVIHFVVFDIKHIFRDAMLRIFLFLPLVLILLARFAVPAIVSAFPILADYQQYIGMGLCMQTAIMMGFISAFILLEEKDQNILPVLRILPISARFFILYRLGFSVVTSFLTAYTMLLLSDFPPFFALFLALQYGLVSALIVLFVATFAQNKIEGMALFKGLDLLLLLPLVSFFVPSFWGYFFAVLPMYFTFHWYESLYHHAQISLWLPYALGGTLVFGLYIFFLYRAFSRRVYN